MLMQEEIACTTVEKRVNFVGWEKNTVGRGDRELWQSAQTSGSMGVLVLVAKPA